MLWNLILGCTISVGSPSLPLKAIKAIPCRRIDDDVFDDPVVVDRFGRCNPIGCVEITVLLEIKPSRRRGPINHHRVGRGQDDGQERCARRLQDEPETASDRVLTVGHGPAGIMLADGAADGIERASAGPSTTGDFVPIDRVLS